MTSAGTTVGLGPGGAARTWIDRLLASFLLAVLVVVVVIEWRAVAGSPAAGILGDLTIYREAIAYRASGGWLYDYVYVHPTVHGLGFTYPPFAALALTPLTWVEEAVLAQFWLGLSFVLGIGLAGFVVLRIAYRGRTWLGRPPTPARIVAGVAAAAILTLISFPFLHQLGVGQISLLLVALCLLDLGGLMPQPVRGLLTGLAAAIKLTPLIFLPYLLITRQWRSAAVMGGSCAAATGIAALVMPDETLAYFTRLVFQTSRVGALDSVINKSVLGALARLGLTGSVAAGCWLVVVAAVAVVVLGEAARAVAASESLHAVLLVGTLGTLASPISWPHHLFWGVLLAVELILRPSRVAILVGLFLMAAMVSLPFYLEAPDPGWPVRLGWQLPVLTSLVACVVPITSARQPTEAS